MKIYIVRCILIDATSVWP